MDHLVDVNYKSHVHIWLKLQYSYIFISKQTQTKKVVFFKNVRTGVKGGGSLNKQYGDFNVYDYLKTVKRSQGC